MPIAIAQPDIDRLKSAIKSRFRGFPQFEAAAGLPQSTMSRFCQSIVSECRAADVVRAADRLLGINIQFGPAIESRFCKAGVPTFNRQQRSAFTALVRESGYSSISKLAEAVGFSDQVFSQMFRNKMSAGHFVRLRDAVLDAIGIDLSDTSILSSVETAAPGPLNDLYRSGLITRAEHAAGHRLAAAADVRDYPGREPLPCLVRSWPADLQAMWRALMVADAETDRCRPRLPTASLVAWNVAVGREALDLLRDPYSRDALTSLRIALQHLPGTAP